MFLICFSDIINENLRNNINDNIVFCQDCGEEVSTNYKATETIRCSKCQEIKNKETKKARNRRYYEKLRRSQKPL